MGFLRSFARKAQQTDDEFVKTYGGYIMRRTKYTQPRSEVYFLKKRVSRTRTKAIWVGFFYLLGTIALAALAVLPTLNIDYISILGEKPVWADLKLGLNVDTISRALYIIMLVILLVNVFVSIAKIDWLYKKKASNTYGFNLNVYAMQEMGQIFSASFSVILIGNVLIALLNGNYGSAELLSFEGFKDLFNESQFLPAVPHVALIIGAGVVLHFVLGVWGAKISLFSVEDGSGVVENKRQMGRFAPFIRNLLQVIVSLVIPTMLLQVNSIDVFVKNALNGTIVVDIPAILQIVIFIIWAVLIVHATNITEYNLDGAEGNGMKNFKVFIALMLVAAGALYAMAYPESLFKFEDVDATKVLIIAGLSLVMFIIEILMRNAPAFVDGIDYSNFEDVQIKNAERNPFASADEVDMDYFFTDRAVR